MIEDNSLCTGCGLCAYKCPNEAISMIIDADGYRKPSVNQSLCVRCGLCIKYCPQENTIPSNKIIEASFCYSINKDILRSSSSGGLFYLLSEFFINQGGKVCACRLDEKMTVEHKIFERIEELHEFQGSKYVESSLSVVYSNIKENIENGFKVLFFGTACQIAAVKSEIRNENLYTVELLCHGVPGFGFFSRYIKHLEEKYDKKVKNIHFRNKRYAGWSCGAAIVVFFQDGTKKVIEGVKDPYYMAFINGISLRESCYSCKYKQKKRISDLTIGDGWFFDRYYPNVNTKDGASIFFVSSKKGEFLLNNIKSKISIYPIELSKSYEINKSLLHHAERTEKHSIFLDNYRENPNLFDTIYVCSPLKGLVTLFKRKVFYFMPFNIKKCFRLIRRLAIKSKTNKRICDTLE